MGISDDDLAAEIDIAIGNTREALEELQARRRDDESEFIASDRVRVEAWEGEPDLMALKIRCLKCGIPFDTPVGKPKDEPVTVTVACPFCSREHTATLTLE